MNSPIQSRTPSTAAQHLAPRSNDRAQAAPRLNGEQVRNRGFSMATAGRILAAVVTLGLSEAGYAIYKTCTRPPADPGRPMGSVKQHLEQAAPSSTYGTKDATGGPSAFMGQNFKVGRPIESLDAQRQEHVDRLLGPEANYDDIEIEGLQDKSQASDNKKELVKKELVECWKSKDNEGTLTLGDWEIQAPAQFGRDCIQRGHVMVRDGKLVASPRGYKIPAEDMQEKMNLVDAFSSNLLSGNDASQFDTVKRNLLSFTHQGAGFFFLGKIAELNPGRIPVNMGEELLEFAFNAEDGKNVVVEQKYTVGEVNVMPTSGNQEVQERVGSFDSKVVFSVPIELLRQKNFDPNCVNIIAADWSLKAN